MILSDFVPLTTQMRDSGIRRLLVIAGEWQWCQRQAQELADRLTGDWLWVGDNIEWPLHCAPGALRSLLGREFQHAVFDARTGLDAAALAALAGTLKAGSWLVLLTPDWQRWPQLPDTDSCRWSDTPEPIATPHFIAWLESCITGSSDAVLWQQNHPLRLKDLPDYPHWYPVNQGPQQEQATVLAKLTAMESGVAVVTAARGRGKSSLAGMLVNHSSGRCLVSAPAKAATDVLAQFAGERFHFIAPDALVQDKPEGDFDWLIVDEAAAIPAPLLQQMIASFPRVLLTTTVQGYEGTGRGFLLKFCASLPSYHAFTLNTPVRWAENDPLERLIDQIMLFDEPDLDSLPAGPVQFAVIDRLDMRSLADIYRLLSGAHYRTSPLDWRRLLDAPGMHYLAATIEQRCAGALWLVEEGGLDPLLSQQVWAGFRRPRGNLVAQSLAAHGGSPLAATLRGLRVSRIAVHPSYQRQLLGSELIKQALSLAQGQYDYLSVSFGYTEELWRFWQRCGFKMVRIGTQREASSGCYTLMALLPLSEAGIRLADAEQQRLFRNSHWYPQLPVDIMADLPALADDSLNDNDWLELAGFAFAHRPLDSARASLHRLLLACEQPLDLLRGQFERGHSHSELCQLFKLTGRKALLSALRSETAMALRKLDLPRCEALQLWVQQIRQVVGQ
ncbi:tRNA(Met) cytidine acetyltransferase TmcA [Klebsiella sp. BIGb0407]|uniref:tRNA(Met) cytidine acetyltransferase TmcA n=1 Tax=Klebsiella sp. BIGb0407 TaxID=2940603 RepID=UPI00216A71E0|nr:GNAT family N-acetyltransferase [Klebsiella sp. BIGb0407]MCS3431856.1 tRNA(Met) cytidine acetyltransferase [Klebsiella sp. BIGb0407]